MMKKELDLGHQIYVIAPMIDNDSDKENVNNLEEKMNKAFGKIADIASIHGKLEPKEKNKIMSEYEKGKIISPTKTEKKELALELLSSLKKNDLLEALMIGVDPQHQGRGLNAIIFNHIRRGAQKYGLKKMVMNPRLETNKKVRAIFDQFNPQLYMRRRCYKANLSTVEQTISTSSSQI